MYSIKITSAEKQNVQSDGSVQLAVGFDIYNDDVIEASYNHGFPLDTTQDDLKAYFAVYLETYTANKVRAAANADFDAANKVADETISNIVGFELNATAQETASVDSEINN